MNRQYDCLVIESFQETALKGMQHFSRASYARAALRGAGVGASVGAAGGAFNDFMKRDDDPTKKGLIKSMASGAVKGAGTGAALGAGARFVTNRQFAQNAMQNMAQNAYNERMVRAARGAADRMKADALATGSKLNSAALADAVNNAQTQAGKDFAREFGYKYTEGARGAADQLKIKTGVNHVFRAPRSKTYDVYKLGADVPGGEKTLTNPLLKET